MPTVLIMGCLKVNLVMKVVSVPCHFCVQTTSEYGGGSAWLVTVMHCCLSTLKLLLVKQEFYCFYFHIYDAL